VLYLEYRLHGARSLKAKRRVIKSLKERLRSRFNCSVAETDHLDVWTRAEVTVCVVSNESKHANTQLDEMARYAAEKVDAELVDYEIELL